MQPGRVGGEPGEANGKYQKSQGQPDAIVAGHTRAESHEVKDELPVGVVHPEVITVLIHDKELGFQGSRQQPLPLGHDGRAGAEDAHHGGLFGAQFRGEALCAIPAAVILYAIDAAVFRTEATGLAGITGDQIHLNVGAVNVVEGADEVVVKGAGPAFDEHDASEVRNPAAEKQVQTYRL